MPNILPAIEVYVDITQGCKAEGYIYLHTPLNTEGGISEIYGN